MKISRRWDMPSSLTFSIPSIAQLIGRYNSLSAISIDPFANQSKIAKIRNDLNPDYKTEYNLDALDFLKLMPDESADLVFYDPPYSLRQVVECYKNVGIEVTQETTQSSWRKNHLDEIQRILKPNGFLLCFGWNSNGAGINRHFEMVELLLVAHGGRHNDTICTVERKKANLFSS